MEKHACPSSITLLTSRYSILIFGSFKEEMKLWPIENFKKDFKVGKSLSSMNRFKNSNVFFVDLTHQFPIG